MDDAPYCPTSCHHLTANGCTIAVGNAKIACPAEDEALRLAMLASGGKGEAKRATPKISARGNERITSWTGEKP